MQNPFTTTYSKAPEYTYISTLQTEEIVDNFRYPRPTEAVYKITGLRGSGKTVILSKVIEEMRTYHSEDGWLIYSLNPSRDILKQLAAYLYEEGLLKREPASRSLNVSATVFGTGGGVGYSSTSESRFFDYGVEIKKMLSAAKRQGKKILICIDEVSKTKEMVTFSLEFADWLIEGYQIYLVCTGLYENVIALGNTKNLTFFRRGTTVATTPLSYERMAAMYEDKLSIDRPEAVRMAEITRGYAYAFQELGALYFKKREDQGLPELIQELKENLFSYSYEKIWEELTPGDREVLRLLKGKEEYEISEAEAAAIDRMNNYLNHRDRLLKMGILARRNGHIFIYPPYFAEYLDEYCA